MSRVTTTTSRLVAGTIAALVLAACSSVTDDANTRTLTPTEPSLSKSSEFNSTRHLFHTKEFYAKPGGGGGRPAGITYHGGTVIAGPAVTKVVAIYWATAPIYPSQPTGKGSGSNDGSLIGSFLNNLGGSPYFNINTTYYDGQGFMLRRTNNIESSLELNGARICVQSDTTSQKNLADYFRSNNLKYTVIAFEKASPADVIKNLARQAGKARIALHATDDDRQRRRPGIRFSHRHRRNEEVAASRHGFDPRAPV
jgi:hypothetical protein